MRSIDSSALQILRRIEEEAFHRRAGKIAVYVSTAIALYVLNQKQNPWRTSKNALCRSDAGSDDSLIPPVCRIEKLADYEGPEPTEKEKSKSPFSIAWVPRRTINRRNESAAVGVGEGRGGPRQSCAWHRRGENDRGAANEEADDSADGNVDDSDDSRRTQEGGCRRRRGRRGGRGRRRKDEGEEADNTVETAKGDVDPIAAEHQSMSSITPAFG